MAYILVGVIGNTELLTDEQMGDGKPVALDQGLSLIPLVGFQEELEAMDGPAEEEVRTCFGRPPPSLVPRLLELSYRGPVAFLEAEYWAGDGEQACIVWHEGDVLLGPLRSAGAINAALKVLGVDRGSARDEFESAGLHRHRSTEDWLTEPGSG